MFCKHCGSKIPAGEKACPSCGKHTGNNVAMIILAAVAGVLVVAVLALALAVGTFGMAAFDWLKFGDSSMDGTTNAPTEAPGTTPTDGNPDDVSCKGTYTADDSLVATEKDTVVATMGDYELTNGQLQIYYWMEVIDFLNRYGSYASYFGLDYTKPLDQQLYDKETGQSWQQFFLQCALDNWHHDHAMFLEAEKAGYEIDSYYQEYLDGLYESLLEGATKDGYNTVDAMLQKDMGAGADYQGYMYYMNRYYKGNLYYNSASSKVAVTQQQIDEYFEKNKDIIKSNYGVDKESGLVADLMYVLFFPDGATSETVGTTTFSDADWEYARAKAQAVLDKWVAEGATVEGFEALIEEYTKEGYTGGGAGVEQNLPQYNMAEVDIRHILLIPEGGEKDANGKMVYTEEAWEACRQKAQAMLDQWVADGADEAVFINLAKEHSQDGNAKDGGIYKNVYKDYMVAEFDAWIFDPSREYGDYGLVKTQYGYHLMFFVHGDTGVDQWLFNEERQEGDYGLIKTDYGYYILRFESREEAWIRYARQGLQAEQMSEEVLALYPLTVYYEKICLWQASL